MIVLLTMGFGVLAIGLLTLLYGAPIKDFSFGNTLIIAGAVTTCTGVLMLGLAMVAREVRRLSRDVAHMAVSRPAAPDIGFPRPFPEKSPVRPQEPAFSRSELPEARAEPTYSSPVMADPVVRPTVEPEPAPMPEEVRRPLGLDPQPLVPPNKPKRNLLFVSSTRRERERERNASAGARAESAPAGAAAYSELKPPVPPAMPDMKLGPKAEPRSEPRQEPQSEPRSEPRAEPRLDVSPAMPERNPSGRGVLETARDTSADAPPATVVKSGTVDGMSYSLFSDGSIEAELAEGMMRFSSIDDLRRHLGGQ